MQEGDTAIERFACEHTSQKAYYTQKIGENPDWEMAGIFADKGIVDPSFQPEVL